MPAYRVEVSPNNRAGCNDALCKKNGVKILKGEIRFGVWVEGTSAGGHEFQGFKWRHWGCVSGKTLQNIQENLTGPLAEAGQYKWDFMDGLEEMPPDYQEKIKMAITEGKIADEDWKGDPAFNVLGKTGIRGRATPKKENFDEGEEGTENNATSETPVKPTTKKRGRAKSEDEDEDEEAKPAKKRATKTKKEADENDESMPVKKPVTKKATKKNENDDEEESKPAKKPRARKAAKKEVDEADEAEQMKMNQDDMINVDVKPAGKSRGKKGSKKGGNTLATTVKTEEDDQPTTDVKPAKKARGKKATKEESSNDSHVKLEGSEDVNVDIKSARNAKGKKVAKKEEADEGNYMKKEGSDDNAENVKPMLKHKKDQSMNGIKKEEDQGVQINVAENPNIAISDAELMQKAEMPEDPLEQIASAFCDRDGPLVGDFKEMVEAQEIAGSDWDGFLQKKFRNMVDAGEVAEDDFKGFLQKMYEREVASGELAPVVPKKGRRGKKASTMTAAPRARRGKAS